MVSSSKAEVTDVYSQVVDAIHNMQEKYDLSFNYSTLLDCITLTIKDSKKFYSESIEFELYKLRGRSGVTSYVESRIEKSIRNILSDYKNVDTDPELVYCDMFEDVLDSIIDSLNITTYTVLYDFNNKVVKVSLEHSSGNILTLAHRISDSDNFNNLVTSMKNFIRTAIKFYRI